ncbi:MAG: four helix bundle protein [Burkholderiales bacterium]|nr:four helix bundle protein [Burkholderiales bacterium]
MALHTQLPIYRTGLELLSLAHSVQEQMPRGMKRTVGEKIAQHCTDILELMALANAAQDTRAHYLRELLKHQRTVEVLLRVGFEAQRVSPKLWAQGVQLLGNIGAQAGGWLKSAKNRAPAV